MHIEIGQAKYGYGIVCILGWAEKYLFVEIQKVPIPFTVVVFWTKTKETNIKICLLLEGVKPLKLTQKIHDFFNFFFYYNGNLLAFVHAFNNAHCHKKLNTQIEH